MPSQLSSNVWILTTAPSAVTTTVTLICPGETMKFIKVKKPIHVLQLLTAWSAISPNFHLPPCYESPTLEVNISLDMANLNMINISSMNFHIWQHLEKHQKDSQLQHLSSITLSCSQDNSTDYMAKGIQHITPFSPEESTGDTDSIWTLFSHTGVYLMAVGLLIAEGLGNLLLLFPLVLTCQISMLTFITRYYMQYTIVDDDVRGSTHLQMWWQGLTAYKTLWESWPACRTYTYTDRESM